jgi:hypothetical protein
MSQIWTPNPDNMLHYWQTIVDEASDELNAWELKFISDIESRVRNKQPLSEKQEQVLERIYADKTK